MSGGIDKYALAQPRRPSTASYNGSSRQWRRVAIYPHWATVSRMTCRGRTILTKMDHGDELVIGDGNFPAASMARSWSGAMATASPNLLDAILRHYLLGTFVESRVPLMAVMLWEQRL